MLEKANSMNNEKNVLPVGFNGVFNFTNFTKSNFTAKWGNIEYTFPPESTTPMVIPNATPEEVQSIRKKFARELAIEEFYRTEKFKKMNDVPPGGVPALYTDSDLTAFTQKCLEPLPIAQATTKVLPKDSEENYRKDRKGKNVTKVLDGNESLLRTGSEEI